MTRILIAGCGDVGCRLALRLLALGHEVWGLRRTVAALPPGVRPLLADLTDVSTPLALPPALDGVVYAAAAGRSDAAAYDALYVGGLTRLLAALVAGGQRPRRVLFTSSTGVYGEDAGGWVDETSLPAPVGFRGERMLAAEAVLAASAFPGVSVRFGGIYGPGRDRLVRRALAEPAWNPGPNWTNRIHADDCAGVLHHLLQLAEPAPLYLGVDSEPSSLLEVVAWIRRELGAPPPSLLDVPREASGKRCSNQRLLASGYRLRYPSFREGYRELLRSAEKGEPSAR